MINTDEYASAVELAHRMGWTLPRTQEWLQRNGIDHPCHGRLIERAKAEALIAGRMLP